MMAESSPQEADGDLSICQIIGQTFDRTEIFERGQVTRAAGFLPLRVRAGGTATRRDGGACGPFSKPRPAQAGRRRRVPVAGRTSSSMETRSTDIRSLVECGTPMGESMCRYSVDGLGVRIFGTVPSGIKAPRRVRIDLHSQVAPASSPSNARARMAVSKSSHSCSGAVKCWSK